MEVPASVRIIKNVGCSAYVYYSYLNYWRKLLQGGLHNLSSTNIVRGNLMTGSYLCGVMKSVYQISGSNTREETPWQGWMGNAN
jgi:hypothetical protein